jgi:hypothetical protein
MVSLPQISKGLITFIEQDLIVHGTSKQKFAMYFIMPQIPQKIEGLFNQYKDSIILKDYITEGGIDLDGLYSSSKQAINKSGNIELFGIILNEQDLDNLYNYISKAIV